VLVNLALFLSLLFAWQESESNMKRWVKGSGVRCVVGAALLLAVLGLSTSVSAAEHGGGGHGGGGHGGGGHGGGGHGGHHHGGGSFGIGFYGGYGGFGYGGLGYPGYGYSGYGYPGLRYPGYGYPGGALRYGGYGYPVYGGYYGRRAVYAYPVGPRYGYPRRTVGRVYITSPQRVDVVPLPRERESRDYYPGTINERGEPIGELRPGMVLPDGSVVVSVGD
jgi:hypothetical protein